MNRRLKVRLFHGWEDVSASNPDGPVTYVRQGSAGALQMSFAIYTGGEQPKADSGVLMGLAIRIVEGIRNEDAAFQVRENGHGECAFGTFGMARGAGATVARATCWQLTNGRDFIFVTHICSEVPSTEECAEAEQIALMTTLSTEKKPWWRWRM